MTYIAASSVRLGLLWCVVSCGSISETGSEAPIDAPAGGVVRFRGSMETTATAPFGGGGVCNYTITLKQVELELGLTAAGDIITGSSQALALEAALPPCPYPPLGANIHRFTMTAVTGAGDSRQLTFVGNPANMPNTSLNVDLRRAANTYLAIATWRRIDQVPPLDWALGGMLTLTQAP
jgi:hypothetical protein